MIVLPSGRWGRRPQGDDHGFAELRCARRAGAGLPFDSFCERDRLYRVVSHWRELAGIEFRTKQRQGPHLLRHTLATRLLRAETPFQAP
jgi:integrase